MSVSLTLNNERFQREISAHQPEEKEFAGILFNYIIRSLHLIAPPLFTVTEPVIFFAVVDGRQLGDSVTFSIMSAFKVVEMVPTEEYASLVKVLKDQVELYKKHPEMMAITLQMFVDIEDRTTIHVV